MQKINMWTYIFTYYILSKITSDVTVNNKGRLDLFNQVW